MEVPNGHRDLGVVEAELTVRLSPEEHGGLTTDMMRLMREAEEGKERADHAYRAEIARLKDLALRAKAIRQVLYDGREKRQLVVHEALTPDNKMVRRFREDTGEELEPRPAEPRDLQGQLFGTLTATFPKPA